MTMDSRRPGGDGSGTVAAALATARSARHGRHWGQGPRRTRTRTRTSTLRAAFVIVRLFLNRLAFDIVVRRGAARLNWAAAVALATAASARRGRRFPSAAASAAHGRRSFLLIDSLDAVVSVTAVITTREEIRGEPTLGVAV